MYPGGACKGLTCASVHPQFCKTYWRTRIIRFIIHLIMLYFVIYPIVAVETILKFKGERIPVPSSVWHYGQYLLMFFNTAVTTATDHSTLAQSVAQEDSQAPTISPSWPRISVSLIMFSSLTDSFVTQYLSSVGTPGIRKSDQCPYQWWSIGVRISILLRHLNLK